MINFIWICEILSLSYLLSEYLNFTLIIVNVAMHHFVTGHSS